MGIYWGVNLITPKYEYQEKHHLFFGKPEEERQPIVENVPIRMRVIFASQRIVFTTGYRIDTAKWEADKQRVKPGCTNKLKQYQDTYAQTMNKYGLQRGVDGSLARHVSTSQYYKELVEQ